MFDFYDISYCLNFECEHKDCARHQINKPQDAYMLSMADFKCDENGECKYYLKRYWR